MSYRVLWLQTQQAFNVNTDETILEAAQRQSVSIPHECTFGGCGTCRIQITQGSFHYADGELPLAMTDEDHAQGFALACQARPQSDLEISVTTGPDCSTAAVFTAQVVQVSQHTPSIYHLALQLPANHGVHYAPGQYLNVLLPDGQKRSFSMAAPLQNDMVELQIRMIENGHFTSSVVPSLKVGDSLDLKLPHGTFHYHVNDYQPMIFAATGTGFAPIKAILQSLLDDDDCPPIHFYWGMREESDLYLLDEIQSWASRLYEFTFIPVLSRPGANWQGRTGYVQDAIMQDFEDLSEHSIYLCGSPSMIEEAKAVFAMSGAATEKIYSDSFLFQNDANCAIAEQE